MNRFIRWFITTPPLAEITLIVVFLGLCIVW